MRDLISADLIYSSGLDVEDWARRNAAGLVPGHWPYGLDKLRFARVDVGTRDTPRQGASIVKADVTFGMNEWVAGSVARSAGPRACGVIWLGERSTPQTTRMRAPFVRRLHRAALRKMDVVFVHSRALVDILPRVIGSVPVVWVPLGIDTDFYPVEDHPDQQMVLSVGNDGSRDIATLYAAMEIVHENYPHVRLVVQTISKIDAPDCVEVYAQFSDHGELRRYYAQSSVIAIASKSNLYTSGSTVALEAQSMGRPVVISGTPGMEDYVDNGVSGYLTPPGDARAMGEAICRLLARPEDAAEMGRQGAQRVRRQNSEIAMANALSQVLRAAVASRTRAG